MCGSLGGAGMPRASAANWQHEAYPTCSRMARGFGYLVAILDRVSRKVLAHRLSNTMTPDACVEALQEALARVGPPEIFNKDQGRSSLMLTSAQ